MQPLFTPPTAITQAELPKTPPGLKIFNGRAWTCEKRDDPRWARMGTTDRVHAYVCAKSRADARRVIEEYCGRLPPDGELKHYFSEGSWGTAMAGVVPERGLWLRFGDFTTPLRVL